MCWTERHLDWLVDTGQTLNTADGVSVPLFELRHEDDEDILSAWAQHFRNHYCRDDDIDEFAEAEELSRKEFLLQVKLPDSSAKPGPSTRAGDFGEILIADYVQYRLGYVVPRTRYSWKTNRNESTQGIDVIGFIMSGSEPSARDKLITFEVKCALSTNSRLTLKKALADSEKDFELRKAESLNAMSQRLKAAGEDEHLRIVRRFQKRVSHPYAETTGAAAVHSTATFTDEVVEKADASNHPNRNNLMILAVKGDELMRLVHSLYRRAADEA